MSGAQAADLPVKAKAVEYVRICSLYGAGFYYIPGTDTCIKLGGYLRIDTTFNGTTYGGPAWSGDLGQGNRYRDYFTSRSRMALTVDTRTATIRRCPHLRSGRFPVRQLQQRHEEPVVDHCGPERYRPLQFVPALRRWRRLCRG